MDARKKVIDLDDLLTQQIEIDGSAPKNSKVSERYSSDDEDEKMKRAMKRRNKVIDLDDLLIDYYTQQSEIDGGALKKSKDSERYSSDDEDEKNEKCNETKFTKMADECEKQMNQIIAEHEIPLWGQKIFGQQKSLPLVDFTQLQNSKLLQTLEENELDLDLHFVSGQGDREAFFERLLINGWLSQLVFMSCFVEAAVASWTFYQAMYSSNEELQLSACDFWCKILLSKNEACGPSIVLEWVPGYHELNDALEFYGYLFDKSKNVGPSSSSDSREPVCEGTPINIRSWIKILSACLQIRKFLPIFSASEVQEILVVIIRLFLDRQLQGLSSILAECLQSILCFFTEDEWFVSCEKFAHSISYCVPKDLNSLRVIECITGVNPRNKHLRSRIGIHILGNLFDKNVSDGKEILKLLLSLKLKDKDINFFNLYIYLVLAENWLLTYESRDESSETMNMWTKFLRNCSSNISSTDWRLYASKVRSKASYLLQGTS